MQTRRLLALLAACALVAGVALGQDHAPGFEVAPASFGTFTRFAVAADHPQASAAGAEVLAAGGTAADAAAATMLALGVASPMSSGLGGGGFALYYRASDRSLTFLDFRERAPAAATPAMYVGAPHGTGPMSEASQLGGLAVGVPGEPAGVAELVRRFGRLPLARDAAPAVRLAEHGFSPSEYLARLSRMVAPQLEADATFAPWLHEGAIAAGTSLTNPTLARTLRMLGARGPSSFYGGPLGRTFVREVRAHGGVLTEADLRAYRVASRAPLSETHFGVRVVSAPPPSSGGYVVLSALDLLERWGAGHEPEPEAVFRMSQALVGPMADRERYVGDPDFTDVPLERLADDARRRARAALLGPRARAASDWALPLEPAAAAPPAHAREEHGTSHLCVIDAQGNVASVTTTVNLPFGARFSVLGLWPNDQMDDFARPADGGAPSPNLPGPGHRPASSMAPTIVLDASGAPVLCIGGSGGSKIPQEVAQVLVRLLARGASPEEAIAAPRLYVTAAGVELEHDAPANVREALRARGVETTESQLPAMVQAIRITAGRLDAASDPRKGGRPAGH